MNAGTALAVLAVAGYLGMELYAVHKYQYRTKPDYIFDRMVAAHAARTSCSDEAGEAFDQFVRNLESVRPRAAKHLAETNPEANMERLSQLVEQREATQRQTIVALVKAKGCESPEARKLLRQFDIYASKRVG